jgi:hypothetical protein
VLAIVGLCVVIEPKVWLNDRVFIGFLFLEGELVGEAYCTEFMGQRVSIYPIYQNGRLHEISSATGEVRKRSSYSRQVLPLSLGKLVASLVERDLVLDNSIRDYLSTGA